MSFFKLAKNLLTVGSLYFTAIAGGMCLISLSGAAPVIETRRFLLILMLSFIMALGTAIYREKEWNRVLRVCLHAAIYNVGFALFLWACGDYDFAGIAIGTLILALIYVICTAIVRYLEKIFSHNGSDKEKKAYSPIKSSPKATEKTRSVATDVKKAPKTKKKEKESKKEYKNLFS